LITYTVSGDDRLPRQAIQAFNDSRIPDGITRSRYPSSMRQIIPTFSLLWVGMVHDFWMYRSDPDFVRAQLSGTRLGSGLVPTAATGRRPADEDSLWPFVDWGTDFGFGVPPQDEDGGSSVMTLQFIERYAMRLIWNPHWATRSGSGSIAAPRRALHRQSTSSAGISTMVCWPIRPHKNITASTRTFSASVRRDSARTTQGCA